MSKDARSGVRLRSAAFCALAAKAPGAFDNEGLLSQDSWPKQEKRFVRNLSESLTTNNRMEVFVR
jgi:hypothetical protein